MEMKTQIALYKVLPMRIMMLEFDHSSLSASASDIPPWIEQTRFGLYNEPTNKRK